MTSKSRRKNFVQFFSVLVLYVNTFTSSTKSIAVVFFFVARIYFADSHWKTRIVWVKQRISAKSLRLSCLSHLFFFSRIIEKRRSFKKLLIHWIIQFDIFLFFRLCSNLTCDTWLYAFVTFTLMIVITLSLSCFHIACISFVNIFNVVSISLSFFALICDFDSNRFFFANSVILLIIIDFNILFIVFNKAIDL